LTGTTISSADLDPRRRRMLFRAWHRGMREMDILMGQFADSALPNMPESELDAFEALLEAPDPELFKWLTGAAPLPAEFDTSVFRALQAHHSHSGPIHV
jgi:antitoxin CptB